MGWSVVRGERRREKICLPGSKLTPTSPYPILSTPSSPFPLMQTKRPLLAPLPGSLTSRDPSTLPEDARSAPATPTQPPPHLGFFLNSPAILAKSLLAPVMSSQVRIVHP
jgi:hypothetical protein